ncbi:MAG: hypothetical protein AAF961_03160 [Planctomycetota bacterium]
MSVPRPLLVFSHALLIVAAWIAAIDAVAQLDFNRDPINYDTMTTTDAIGTLQAKIESGEATLEWDEQHGWLPALLENLDVKRSSQTLVFSKTSQQLQRISPRRPRALYFSDEVYVGWVQDGDFVELSAVDPKQGAIFYTAAQERTRKPEIRRDKGQCIVCHGSSKTAGVPGYLVRSVFAGADGHPLFRLGTTTTDHRTPLSDRYGGWYVTGTHGDMRHRGNAIASERESPPIDGEAGANLAELTRHCQIESYLEPTSDLTALMVLEHQTTMHNLITRASYIARQTTHQQQAMNEALNRPRDFLSESALRRIHNAAEELLKYMLFCDEFQLTSPVAGTSEFAAEFQRRGPRDSQGRSLRDFDLTHRMFKHPCSFLIYSESYESLPDIVLGHLERRLVEVLEGVDHSTNFSHLSPADRKAIREIVMETKPCLLRGSSL